LSAEHPSRIEAGIVFSINEMIDEGHVYVPQEHLAERAVELLDIPSEQISPALERLAQDDRIRADLVPIGNRNGKEAKDGVAEAQADYKIPVVYLTPLYFAERGIAERLRMLSSANIQTNLENKIDPSSGNLSEEQRAALEMALARPLSILTGGPGTGKTTCLKALIAVLEHQDKRYGRL
jgi:exodeoxyribonuclease V alpha subunit